MIASPLLYNQSTLSDDDFVANFVARGDVLDTLLRRLRAIDPDAAGDHQILIGTRGMGKSSLLRRLAIAINREPDLAVHYIPLTFREEQYNVLTIGDFWRNCGEALAEWAEQAGLPDLAATLDNALATKAWAGNDAPIEQLNKALAKVQRRAVLLVDNLDLILDSLKDEAHWVLRRHLQARRGPIMIGAATRPLVQSADREAAFYQFFQPHHLEPLNQRETETCMRALAQRRGDHGMPVTSVLNTQPERLRTLHTLTGGNPRVLTLIYRLLEASETNEAMADLDILLDQVTPYYKARIEEYQTAQQRAVIDAIALHWDPITVGTLADITDIATTTLSPLLIKLRKDGLIETTEVSGSSTGHQITERFLNIWYLMRHGTRRTKYKLRWLVHFLNSFYSSDDLNEISRRISDNIVDKYCHSDYQFAVREALSLSMSRDGMSKGLPVGETGGFATGSEGQDLVDSSEKRNRAVKTKNTDPKDRVATARKLMSRGVSLRENGDFLAAASIFNDIVTRLGDATEPALQEQVARALVNKGITHREMGDNAAALDAYDMVIARFGDANEPGLLGAVAGALALKGFAHRSIGDNAAALDAFDTVVARFGDATEPDLRETVALALVSKGFVHESMGENAAAHDAYNMVIARFGYATEPGLREQVAWALGNKGFAHRKMGDYRAALDAYDNVISRFGDATEPGLRERVAQALVSKGIAHREMGDNAAALDAYDMVIARFGDATEPGLLGPVAFALVFKGFAHRSIGDNAAALDAFDTVVARFGDATEPDLRDAVARALVSKGFVHESMGENVAAHDVYDMVIARFADAIEPGLREQVAQARMGSGNLLIEIDSDLARAGGLFQSAVTVFPVPANGNLAWAYLLDDKVGAAQALWHELEALPPLGKALLEAALAVCQDNFGFATQALSTVLNGELDDGGWSFTDYLHRLIRITERKGYGERLITWFEETGFAEQVAPVYVALKAFVRGETVLLDVNPEVRGPAQAIYNKLDAPRRHRRQTTAEPATPPRRRGRPRKTN